jgi:hypothetical protein
MSEDANSKRRRTAGVYISNFTEYYEKTGEWHRCLICIIKFQKSSFYRHINECVWTQGGEQNSRGQDAQNLTPSNLDADFAAVEEETAGALVEPSNPPVTSCLSRCLAPAT